MLVAPNLTPTSSTAFLPKGVILSLELINLNRNPRHFPEPHQFRPRRWEDPEIVDSFQGFAMGPRLCLGKKFAIVEGVAILSNALRDWKFEPKLANGETAKQWAERILVPKIAVTLDLREFF